MHFFFKLDSQHSENSSCRGKISAQPHTTLCIQFLDRENSDKNNTLPLGKHIFFIIVWGCAEVLPPKYFQNVFLTLPKKCSNFHSFACSCSYVRPSLYGY